MHDGPPCDAQVRVVTPTDAWWTRAFPRTFLGGAISMSDFYKPTFLGYFKRSFLERRKATFLPLLTYLNLFHKFGPLQCSHLTTLTLNQKN